MKLGIRARRVEANFVTFLNHIKFMSSKIHSVIFTMGFLVSVFLS